MHRALRIPEILLMIFKCVFRPPHPLAFPGIQNNSDMVSLARTCHAFREPALDILWSYLSNLSAITRCVPDAIYAQSLLQQDGSPYTFYRGLTTDEWNILRQYTSRIRVIKTFDLGPGLDPVPANLFEQDLLFRNLRELDLFVPRDGISPWLRQQHIPSLDSINICSSAVGEPSFLREGIAPLSEFYPNLTKITMKGCVNGVWSPGSVYSWPWKDLRVLDCPDLKLETQDLEHLSRLPSLSKLTFSLRNAEDIVAALSSERSVLVFPNLKELKLAYYCPSLELTSSFLAQVALPAVQKLVVHADGCLTKDIGPFLSAVYASYNNHSNGPNNVLQSFRLTDISLLEIAERSLDSNDPEVLPSQSDMETLQTWASQRSLTFDDLQPVMAFTNIREVELDVAVHIRLNDDAILRLVSAWPFLDHLSINETTGWNRPGSVNGFITLGGLRQLLLKCPLLRHIGLVMHVPDSITDATVQSMLTTDLKLRSSFRGTFYMNLMDSIIDSEVSIPAIATFLAFIVGGRYERFELEAWMAFNCQLYSKRTVKANRARWNNVGRTVGDILKPLVKDAGN